MGSECKHYNYVGTEGRGIWCSDCGQHLPSRGKQNELPEGEKKHERLSNIDGAKVIQVIEVKSIVGEGTHESPIRQITEYFSLEGERIEGRKNGKIKN